MYHYRSGEYSDWPGCNFINLSGTVVLVQVNIRQPKLTKGDICKSCNNTDRYSGVMGTDGGYNYKYVSQIANSTPREQLRKEVGGPARAWFVILVKICQDFPQELSQLL